MKLTVAICTWNRAALLSKCLDQLARLRQPGVPWEIVVVNNNSTDNTGQVINSFRSRLPLLPAFEPRQGLSHARNTAVLNATGDYVIWTDDDVLVDAGWLIAYERAFEQRPQAAIFGGPVRARFEGTPPRWLSATAPVLGAAFAERELGNEPFELADDERIPWGANFAVRMREQKQFPYDQSLGRNHVAGALGDETAVIRAVLRSGGTGWWVPDAVVEHWIPKKRQTIKYLRSYYALVGKTYYQWDPRRAPKLGGRPLSPRHQALLAEWAYRLARLGGSPQRWIKLLVRASILRGAIRNLGSE